MTATPAPNLARQSLFYAIAIGLQRGLPLLCLLPAMQLLGVEGYGIYAIVQTLIALFSTWLSMNGAAAVLREGAENPVLGDNLFWRFQPLTVLLTTAALVLAWMVSLPGWTVPTIVLGGLEASHLGLFSAMRARGQALAYLFFAGIRATGVVAVLGYCIVTGRQEIETVLGLQAVLYFFMTVGGVVALGLRPPSFVHLFSGVERSILAYSAPLVIHISAQWAIVYSSRIIIFERAGEAASSLYSMLYTVATPIALIVSLLGIIVPVSQIQNIEAWRSGQMSLVFIRAAALVAFLLALVLQIAAALSIRWGIVTELNNPDSVLILTLVSAALFMMCGYTIYGSFFLYFRRSVAFSSITVGAGVLALGLGWVLIGMFGALGAALTACITNALYLALMIAVAQRYDPIIRASGIRDYGLILGIAAIIAVASYVTGETARSLYAFSSN